MPLTAPTTRTPEIAEIPSIAADRLIDEGMLQYEASVAGFAERYRRGETPHTIHVWWARRPHSAMRALAFACLCRDRSPEAIEIMRDIACPAVDQPALPDEALRLLALQHPTPPRLLDMFGGSGTIGFEAACLGANVSSIDTNQLAVFIQRNTMLDWRLAARSDLACLVRDSGRNVLERLARNSAPLFPRRDRFFGYFWTYAQHCPSCRFRFYLGKRPWLSKRSGKRIALKLLDGGRGQRFEVAEVLPEFSPASVWTGKGGSAQCPKCGCATRSPLVGECDEELVAVVGNAPRRGKFFVCADGEEMPEASVVRDLECQALESLGMELPESQLPVWSGIVNPALYGMRTHADFLNPRQRAVLLLLIRCLRDEFAALRCREGIQTALSVTSFLSGLIDQLIDWNCRLSMWIAQNEQVGRAFCGPGIAMLWDYVEIDPVQSGPANLNKKLDRIVAGMRGLSRIKTEADVRLACAQHLPFKNAEFDAIVTDPPYYDNLYYNALADFFFTWKRLLFHAIDPELFSAPRTNDATELVASTKRSGSAEKAHVDYCEKLGRVMREAERVLKPDGVFALLYSHSALSGWEAIIQAYRPTGLIITSVQPLSIERKQRPRAMTSEAVNTCVVFVARHGEGRKRICHLDAISNRLQNTAETLKASLSEAGWHDDDIGVAIYSQAVGMLANVAGIHGLNDRESLVQMAAVVKRTIPTFKVVDRKPL